MITYKKLYKLSEDPMENIQFKLIGLLHTYTESSEKVYLEGVKDILWNMYSWYLGSKPSKVTVEDLISDEILKPGMPKGIAELLIPTIKAVVGKEKYEPASVISVFDCCEMFSVMIEMKTFVEECKKRGVDLEY